MASDGTIKITTDLDTASAQKALSKFGSITKAGLKGASVAVAAVSTALIGVTGYAVKTGIEFESAFAGVKKTVNATAEELEGFRDGILDMSKQIPQSAASIAAIAEAAGQLGIQNKNILSFTEVMANLGVATNMSATVAATALARLANITQMPQENFDRLGSTIVELGNKMATTESEITEMGLRLAGAGKQVGMSEAKIMGLAAALSSVGIEADAGGSSVSTVMAKMQLAVEKGGDSLDEFASVAGMTGEEFKTAFEEDAASALVSFITGLGTMDERGQSAIKTLDDMGITEIRQRDALLRLSSAGDILSESIGIATKAWDENNALTKEAEQRYETLESRLQLLKNNVDDFGIAVYDSMRSPLKNTVDEGIQYIEQLKGAFEAGGLRGAVEEAGDIFADLATNIADQAPKMVRSSVEFISAFCSGIYDNRGQLLNAAGNIAKSLADGLADLLPRSISTPVKKAVSEMSSSFQSGGLQKTISVVSTAFSRLTNAIGTVAKVALPPLTKSLNLVGGNFSKIAPIVVAVGVATKSYGAITKTVTNITKAHAIATSALTKMEAANSLQLVAVNGGLTARQTLIALQNGQITVTTALTGLWAKAQTTLNAAMSANPIGIVITAVAALAAGIGVLALVTDNASEAEKKHAEELRRQEEAWKEQKKATDERKKSYEEFSETQNRQAAADVQQTQNLQTLNLELQSLVDENGNVKEGEENRASFITSQLASALGIEIELTDGQIQNYQELQEEITNLIEKKRIEAVLSAQEAKYKEAVNNQMEAAAEAQKNLTSVTQAQNEVDEKKAALDKTKAEQQKLIENGNADLANSYYGLIQQQERDVEAAQRNLDKRQETYEKSTAILAQYASDIDMYTALAEAAATGNGAAIEQAIAQITHGIKTASTATNQELQTQVKQVADFEQYIRDEVQKGSPGFTQDMLTQASNATKAAVEELAKAAPQSASEISKVPPAAVAALVAGNLKGELSSEASGAVEGMIAQFETLDADTKAAFSQAIYGALEGLEGFEQVKDPAKEGADAFLESLREVLEVHSPSRAVKDIFSQVVPGALDGVEEGKEGLLEKGKNLVFDFLNSLGSGENDAAAQGIGSRLMTYFGIGVSSQSESSRSAGQQNANAANQGASSVNPNATGGLFGRLFNIGISGKRGEASSAGQQNASAANQGAGSINPNATGGLFGRLFSIGISGKRGDANSSGRGNANAAKSGAGSVDPSSTGTSFGSKYASSVGAKAGESNRSGKSLADSAKDGAGTADAYSVGSNFGSGFVRGIGSWISSAASKAAELAKSAYDAAKNLLGIESPSKEMKKVGHWFSEGFAIGINEEVKGAQKASQALSESARDAFDVVDLSDKLKGIDVPEIMGQMHLAVETKQSKTAERLIASVASAEAFRLNTQNATATFSDQHIQKLAKAFSKEVATNIAKEMDGMGMYAKERELFRLMREVK